VNAIKAVVADAEFDLIEGRGGIFDVKLGDETVYSKHQNGNQFPEEGPLVDRLRELIS